MKKFIITLFLLTLFIATFASGCGGSTPISGTPATTTIKTTSTTAAVSLTANDYCTELKASGLTIDSIEVYTTENDPNKLLGRPNQYTSKVNFVDTAIKPEGGSVEVFANNSDAQNRKKYIDEIGKNMPAMVEYSYINNNALLRLNKEFTPDQAKVYETKFMDIK